MKKLSVLLAFIAILMIVACGDNGGNGNYAETTIRDLVDGLDALVELADGRMVPAINLDNAATTPAFKAVLEEILKESKYYASIGRGTGQKSRHSTQVYEKARGDVLAFFGADSAKYSVIYVNNTTDGINRLSMMLLGSPDDLVLTTRMEHHANDLPWRFRARAVYADVDSMGRLNMEDLERLLIKHEGKIKYVAVSAASNATGYVNDVHRIARIARSHGAKTVVDGAQIAAHRRFSMRCADDESGDIDYFVFSAHKMYAPFGSGAIIGLKSELERLHPAVLGGGNVSVVGDTAVFFEKVMPLRHDVGSPNYFGVVAMRKAMQILDSIGFEYIEEHEQVLMRRALGELTQMSDIILYGDSENIEDRVGILLFNIKDMNADTVARKLADNSGISVRTGAFCSHPYAARLMGIDDDILSDPQSGVFPRMVRASFGIYNNEEDVDALIAALKEIIDKKKAGG
ncbi:MAG: aminotransferase class V-fold PLP-dependent enzyme [Chitinispirillales bacterium]|nr:aminotransferase class V-fold PLP-dependent enzyme [Chitinispirillales bacterium]